MTLRSLLVCIALSFAPGLALADGIVFAIGYADRDSIKGAEVALGYRKSLGSVGFNVHPLTGIWHRNTGSRFRNETFSNGTTVCRDTSNGQFTDSENCDPKFSYAFIASADYALSDGFHFGVGARIGKKTDPFVTVRVRVAPTVSIQFRGGGEYLSGGIAFAF